MRIEEDFQGYFLNAIRKILSANREYFYRLSDQADKIIVWLVGFSVGSIALTLSNTELDEKIENFTSNVLIFGSVTIILGVSYRIFIYLTQAIELNVTIGFEAYVKGYNDSYNFSSGRDIIDIDSYEDIVDFLKEDFNIEIKKIDTSNLGGDKIIILRQSAIDYYHTLNNLNNERFDEDIREIKKVLSAHLGYSKKRLDRMFNPKEPKIKQTTVYWFCYYSASALFILSCLSFITGVSSILIQYLSCS